MVLMVDLPVARMTAAEIASCEHPPNLRRTVLLLYNKENHMYSTVPVRSTPGLRLLSRPRPRSSR